MRLTNEQIDRIRETAVRLLGPGARVRLFGSRVRDDVRGGDIDLLFETDMIVPNRAEMLCRLHGALVLGLGDRKMDILLKDPNTPPAQVFEVARRTGVIL